ncbi:MAG TPA: 3-oxoacyl-ACP reductase family protein [Acidobacteriaceae bacterium]|jgi:glucose 1-dehydrogenase/3-oxoacyl-[acyl-carrier protein] reductase|nr:3-oxoacyl-ACP reductase family protein [Acidobacteriaceae bacterium]
MKLRNKVALITGASQGIGKGIAEVFAEEGADLVINHVGSCDKACAVAEWVRSKGRRALVVEADVRERSQVEAMFERAEKELGRVDVLVNNAGIETIVPFLDLTDRQWSDLVNTNLWGEWLCSQVFCRQAVAAGRAGSIVNIGSIQAGKVLPGRTHYAPAKLAIEALTRNVSAEMGALGIRVNCIHPGLIETPMVDWVLKHPDPSILAGVVAQISLGRAGQPQEIGTVAAFFASDEAKYVTGQSLYVDGGWVGK